MYYIRCLYKYYYLIGYLCRPARSDRMVNHAQTNQRHQQTYRNYFSRIGEKSQFAN